jgi:hypothetical protein
MSYVRGLGAATAEGVIISDPQKQAALTNYVICLSTVSKDNEVRFQRAKQATEAWAVAARQAGVFEGSIIAVLGPFNVWEEVAATMSGNIDREIYRVQHGGAVPNEATWYGGCGDTSPWRIPNAIALPDIAALVTKQGGAVKGTAQYQGTTPVVVEREVIAIPKGVSLAPTPTLITNVKAQYAPEQQAQMLPQQLSPGTVPQGSLDAPPVLDFGGNGSSNNKTLLLVAAAAGLFFLFGRRKRG